MERVWTHLRAQSQQRPMDAGVSLVEMLVALTIMSLMMTGVAYGLTRTLWLSRDSKSREVGAQLASEAIDQARATSDISALDGDTWVKTVNGLDFTVLRTVTPYLNNGAASPCDGSGNAAIKYKRITISVTWPNMSSTTNPVRADTLLTPSASSYDPTKGNIASKVVNAKGKAVEGVLVTATDALAISSTQYTDESGCAFFDGMSAGAYTVTATKTGYVSSAGTAVPSTPASVIAANTTAVAFDYDVAGSLGVVLGDSTYLAPVSVPVGLGNTSLVPDGTITAVGTGNARVISNVYPFASGYAEWAGSCQDADPAGLAGGSTPYHPGAVRVAPAVTTVAGLPAVALEMSKVRFAVLNTVGVAQVGVQITVTHAGTAPCDVSETYVVGVTNASGQVLASLPYGTWNVTLLGRSLSAVLTPILHPQAGEIYVEARTP